MERHTEHKSEIDAREDSFSATATAGQELLSTLEYRVYNVLSVGTDFEGNTPNL